MSEQVRSKISDIKIPILKPDNYSEWKIKITSLLKAKELYAFVESKPEQEEIEDENFTRVNEEAKSIIYGSLDGKTTQAAGICETAHELWTKVIGSFEGLADDLTGIAVTRFMEISKQSSENLSDYLGRFEIALNNLASTNMAIELPLATYVLSRSLPQNIKEGIRIWRTVTKPEDATIEKLISYVRANYREEDAQTDANSAAFLGVRNKRKWRARKAPNYPNRTGNNQGGTKSATSSATCTYCKKEGHIWQNCFKLKKENEQKKSDYRKERAHMALERSFQVYQEYLPEKAKNRWIIDSGATSHMAHNKSIFSTFKRYDTPKEILVGDGEHINAEGEGWVFFRGKNQAMVLKRVLYVPKMPVNLFSVKAALEEGYNVSFSKKNVKVEHRGEPLEAFFDGCLFTVNLDILSKQNFPTEALAAFTLDQWHRRLNHCGLDLIKRMQKDKMVLGLNIGNNTFQCEDCIMGKSCRKPHPTRTQIRATKELAILHFDTVDTSVQSLGGKRYFVLGTEEFSGYKLIDFVAKKSQITNCVKLMINSVILNARRPVACIYSDNGTEFVNIDLREWLDERGIIHELSSAYNAEQNGRAEASNKTVINGARTYLTSSKLPKKLWAEACSASVYVLNRLPSITKPTVTRYELYYGYKPDVSNLHEFGELAIRLIPKQLRDNKLDPVGKQYRFVGYTNRFNTFRLYDEANEKIVIDCNVRFLNRQPTPSETIDLEDDYSSIRWENVVIQSHKPTELLHTTDQSNSSVIANVSNSVLGNDDDTIIYSRPSTSNNVNDAIHQEIRNRNPPQEVTNSGRILRSMTGTLKPIYDPKSLIPGYVPEIERRKSGRDVVLYSLNDEPETVKQAKESKDWEKWQQAMKEEIQALEENQTWVIVDKPPNVRPIKAKWIFKLKLNTDGSVERYKARLVAKGYSQIPDIDYKQTFAPVASMTTVRMLLAASVQYNMKIVQFDIKTAFLHGDLDEELYMECPEYYEAPEGKVCRLTKSLYGLKQAPRQWHKKFDSFLKKFKLNQSSYDKCLYYSVDRKVMLTIYVDDGLIIAESNKLALQLIDFLKEFLTVKTMDCKSYLGLEIIREREILFVTQSLYIKKTLEKFGMSSCKQSSTPEEVGQVDYDSAPKLKENFPFKELIGCLLYITTCTRPDIAHAVSVASRTSEPTEAHWASLKRILRYLKGTSELGLVYKHQDSPVIRGYSDADYANCKKTRRSTSGFVIMWGDNVLTWKCQRQKITTLSTTEAEYVAGTEMVKKLIPLKAMMTELNLVSQAPAEVFIDNKSTINIVVNEEAQDRTKHIDVRHKWLTEHHNSGSIKIAHISGDQQKADILTKPLHPTKFATNRNWLLGSLAMLLTLSCISTPSSSILLKRALPVYYKSSDVEYVNQLQKIRFKIVIVNPCESYFRNITENLSINKHLIDDCEKAYRNIVRLDQCRNNTPAIHLGKREINLESVSGLFTSISKEIGLSGGTVVMEHIQSPNVTVNEREKRFLPALAVVATVVIVGNQAYMSHSLDVNVSNVKELAKATNMEREFLRQSYGVLKETRETIHDINHRIAHLEHRVDYIDRTIDKFPKIIALVNKYDSDFNDIQEILADIDNAAIYHQASPSIFKFTRNSTLLGLKREQLQLEFCGEELNRNDKNVAFNYQILMPQIDRRVKIMEAEAFRFWNQTAPSKFCWMKYSGPRYVLVNTTNSCQLDVQEYWISSKSVSNHPCNQDNKQLESITKLYNPDVCRNNFTGDTKDIQIKHHNGLYKIYCFGNNITVGDQKLPCPDYVFELPLSERFELNEEVHDLGEVSTITVNTIELYINDQLTERLKTDKIKIYGSNTTALDSAFGRLSRLTESIRADVKQFGQPVSNWLLRGNWLDIFKAPFKWIENLINEFSTVITVIACILAVVIFFPVLEIALVLWKVGCKLFTALTIFLRAIVRRARRNTTRNPSRNRIRRYLTSV